MGVPPRPLITAVVVSWLCLCALGMWQIADHTTAAGSVGNVPEALPLDIAKRLDWNGECSLLLLAAHPQCPCLPASLDELGSVLATAENTTLRILVFEPRQAPRSWDRSASETLFRGLPKGTVVRDRDGELAAQLGARTSGHVSCYDATGHLQFAGGITGSRGHRGDNPNRRALTAALQQSATRSHRAATGAPTRTAVFGCPLDTPCDCDQ